MSSLLFVPWTIRSVNTSDSKHIHCYQRNQSITCSCLTFQHHCRDKYQLTINTNITRPEPGCRKPTVFSHYIESAVIKEEAVFMIVETGYGCNDDGCKSTTFTKKGWPMSQIIHLQYDHFLLVFACKISKLFEEECRFFEVFFGPRLYFD